jgi:hypothetical protein
MQPKLSRLQKQILLLALANKQRENRGFEERTLADVLYSEILMEVYRFRPIEPLRDKTGKRDVSRKFDPVLIGRARYNAALAAVSRAIRRLEQRGLAWSVRGNYTPWAGCSLTPEGLPLAKQLSQPDGATGITVTDGLAAPWPGT